MARALALVLLAGCAPEPLGERTEALTVCPGPNLVEGIDVSVYQGTIDWPMVRAAGKQFAFIRASHGVGGDTEFARNFTQAKAAGLIRGPYHYFTPADDPVVQADLMLSQLGDAGGLQAGDLPPVIDIEESGGQTVQVIQQKMTTFIGRVEAATGRQMLLYTSVGTFANAGNPAGFNDHPLWVANYNVTCPMMPQGWTAWQFWQYTSMGHVAGISTNVDLDHFNGTIEQLMAFANPPPDAGAGDGGAHPMSSDGGCSAASGGEASPLLALLTACGGLSFARRRAWARCRASGPRRRGS